MHTSLSTILMYRWSENRKY